VSWEEGFCDGLVKSRIFMPILSRNAINDPDKSSQNFAQLEETSRCDNVLLEHLLAVELQQRGLIERIYPVMIGDRIIDRDNNNASLVTYRYTNYFATGCHPSLPKETESVIVRAVDDQLRAHLDRLCLGTPLLENMTVTRILNMLTKNQGKLVEGPEASAFESILADVKKMANGRSSNTRTI
jgi:hypothetical protein